MSASVLKYVPPHQNIELTAGMVDPSFVAEIHWTFPFTKLIIKRVVEQIMQLVRKPIAKQITKQVIQVIKHIIRLIIKTRKLII